MSAIPYAIAGLVITATACTAGLAKQQTDAKPEALVCELRLSEQGNTVTVTAQARAQQATRGTYSLTVEQRSAGGRSTIRQGGEFDLKAGAHSVLSEASFTARARDLDAELTLEANGQRKTCRALTL